MSDKRGASDDWSYPNAERVAVGAALYGGAEGYRRYSAKKRGLTGGARQLIRETYKNKKVSPNHLSHIKRYVATRGVAGTGAALMISGAVRESKKPLDYRKEIVDSVGRGTIGADLVESDVKPKDKSTVDRYKRRGTVAGVVAGGAVTGALMGRAAKRVPLAGSIPAGVTSSALGIIGGAKAGNSIGGVLGRRQQRHDVRQRRERLNDRAGAVSKLMSPSEVKERQKQQKLRRTQQVLGVTSAGMGLTAVGMKAPQIARIATRGRAPKKLLALENKWKEPSDLVGSGAFGIGSVNTLNSVRVNRKQNEIDQKYVIKKEYMYEGVSKLGVPRMAAPRVKPVRFGGVKSGGFYRSPTGAMRYRRGSLG